MSHCLHFFDNDRQKRHKKTAAFATERSFRFKATKRRSSPTSSAKALPTYPPSPPRLSRYPRCRPEGASCMRDDQHKYDKQKNVYPFHTASEFSILYHIIAQKANHRYIKNFSFTNFQTFEHYSAYVSFPRSIVMPVPVRADVVVPVRADVVGGKVGRCDRRRSWVRYFYLTFATLSFVQVLSRDGVNHFCHFTVSLRKDRGEASRSRSVRLYRSECT